MEFTVGPSPSNDVVLGKYEAGLFPKFRIIFEGPWHGRSFEFLAQSADEAELAVVIENRADRDITALRYHWVMTDENKNEKKHTVSSDSYMVDVYYPVLRAGDRKLVTRRTSVDESVLDHVLCGGGSMGAGFRGDAESLVGTVSLRLSIDMLLFVDGEIAGPDTTGFAGELKSRKPAAEFVAKQIRLAQVENRDVTPVLSALGDIPCLGGLGHGQGDPLVHWTRRYAREHLHAVGRTIGKVDIPAKLRHLENRPMLPRFYRAGNGTQ